jgi:hypothetical protein
MDIIFSRGMALSSSVNLSMLNDAAAYDFILKGFSPWMSISLERREKFSAITSLETAMGLCLGR